jgi:hypothetical protein
MTHSSRLVLVLLAVPITATAQTNVLNTPFPLPKALVFPNYDNVLVGKNQAIEGGAYIARANDASANFYNPAGLVAAEKTSLNASSTGYVWTRLSSKASGESIDSSKIDSLPGYFGAVFEPPFWDVRNVRLGVSITRVVSWSPGGIDTVLSQANPNDDFDRLTYSTTSNFGTQVYQLAGAWSPDKDRSIRLGFGVGLAQTTFSSSVSLSGRLTQNGQTGQFLESLRANGTDDAVLFTIGAQWDVVAGLTVGAIIRPPSIHLGGSSTVTQEASNVQATSSTSTYFRDENGSFRYKLPLEVGVGVAYRIGDLEIEGDLRYHDSQSTYAFYKSNVPYQVLTQNANGTTSTSTLPPPTINYAAQRVVNGAIGGNWRVGAIATVHAGFYSALSPVSDPVTSPLRKADLFGFTGGVDFQLARFGASLGAGYQFGTAHALSQPSALGVGDVDLKSISIFYAISFQF